MKLQDYLDKNKISVPKFADTIKVHRDTVYKWVRGESSPNKTYMPLVFKHTKGKVTANDFMEKDSE